MTDNIKKETERIHQGIVESLSFSEALAKRDAEIERLRHEVKLREQICADAALYARRLQEADDEIEWLRKALASSCDEQRQLYREEANLPCEAAVEAQVLKDEIKRLRGRIQMAEAERDAANSLAKNRYASRASCLACYVRQAY